MTSWSFFSFLSANFTSDGVSSRLRRRVVSSSTSTNRPASGSPSTRSEAITSPVRGSCRLAWMRIRSPARTKLPTSAVVACAWRATLETTWPESERSSRWPVSSRIW